MAESKPKQESTADAPGNDEVQKVADEQTDLGYWGTETDQTPNEHYTVAGVIAGKPTPETDPEAKANALK